MDATSRLLETLAGQRPLMLVPDDLQWADESSLALLEFVARAPLPAPIALVGAYRDNEVSSAALHHLAASVTHGELLHGGGLDPDATRHLLERVTGHTVPPATAAAIDRRSGGHPLFIRELALLADHADSRRPRDPSDQGRDRSPCRLALLEKTIAVLETTAVLGPVLLPDVVAAALGISAVDVAKAAQAAVDAGLFARTETGISFAHDLLRETTLDRIDLPRRMALHVSIGSALEVRMTRDGQVAPSELARHFIAAVR